MREGLLAALVLASCVSAQAVTYHRSFRNGYPANARSNAATTLVVEPSDRLAKLLLTLVPQEKLNAIAGFFAPVTRRYMPRFEQMGREYLRSTDKSRVVARFLPTFEKALEEARALPVSPKYEKEKADYIKLLEAALASARLVARFQASNAP